MAEAVTDAQRGIAATNPSVQDERLVDLIERHGREEGRILAEYQGFRDTAESPMARYLVGLIVDDEHRHHRILKEMANSIAWGGFASGRGVDAIPEPTGRAPVDLIEQTRRLLEFERNDERELKTLRRELKDYAQSTAWRLLIDTLLLDTKKHQLMLEFILEQARPGE